MREVLAFVRTALLFFFILWVVFFFVVGIKMVPNDDMYPRMSAGDIMMYYRLDKKINPQDVIVLKKNGTEYVGRRRSLRSIRNCIRITSARSQRSSWKRSAARPSMLSEEKAR